ncbi:hypothetical protein F4677DRAFT_122067 [Hypoxylon crocopeplum]|nr:hypothetical protein F4677DRAFT_122067 [Hypoxylon crocopeplum]
MEDVDKICNSLTIFFLNFLSFPFLLILIILLRTFTIRIGILPFLSFFLSSLSSSYRGAKRKELAV